MNGDYGLYLETWDSKCGYADTFKFGIDKLNGICLNWFNETQETAHQNQDVLNSWLKKHEQDLIDEANYDPCGMGGPRFDKISLKGNDGKLYSFEFPIPYSHFPTTCRVIALKREKLYEH